MSKQAGNFFFQWQAVAATGVIEGVYEQTIYGDNLVAAVEQFTSYHGDLAPDTEGVCHVITNITWQPV